MKLMKKFSKAILVVVLCLLLATTAWATEQIIASYSATLNESVFCANDLKDQAQTVTLTAKVNELVAMDAFTAQVKVPEGWSITAISNNKLAKNFNVNLENGMVLWYADDAKNVDNDLLATATIQIPAGTPAGEYEVEFEIIDISRDFGMPWEDGKVLTAKLTVSAHADGDDADHLCDICQSAIEGVDCVYVPGEAVWGENNTCTVVGTCACGKTATATASVTSQTTPGTCQTEAVTTYTATFTESWITEKTVTKNVVGEKDSNNHTGVNHVEGYKPATVEVPGYTGDTYCECGVLIQAGSVIEKLDGQIVVEEIKEVPESIADKYETVDKLAEAMSEGTVAQYESVLTEAGLDADDVTPVIQDVVLKYRDPVTGELVEADKEHFPENGNLVVELPVPEGTNHENFTFFVSHMFTSDAFGKTPGDIEYPEVTEVTIGGQEYISFSVTGLSPVTVCYAHTDCDWSQVDYTVDESHHTANYECVVPGCDKTKSDEPVEHTYTDGKCECGAEESGEPVANINVVSKKIDTYTVNGNVVNVKFNIACKVGYWDEAAGKYIAIPAVAEVDGSYSFIAPDGVEEVLLVINGDVTGDGKLNAADTGKLNSYILKRGDLTAVAMFAGEVTGDGKYNAGDTGKINASILGRAALTWN